MSDSVNKRVKFILSSDEQAAMNGFNKVENASKSLQATLGKLGLAFGAMEVAKFGFDAAKSAAQLDVLRENFNGTAKDIENFRKATAGTVSEASLIKLSNQASDLGVTLQQQIILFAAAENAGDKYGGSIEENFQRIVLASEGATKGLKALGIQKEIFEATVNRLAKAQGNVINNLDAETQKSIRLQAIIQSLNMTMEEATNKTQDAADKIESWGVWWEETTAKIGSVTLPVLFGLNDAIEKIYYGLVSIGNLPKQLLYTIGIDISDEALGLIQKTTYGGDKNGLAPQGSMERLAQDIQAQNAKEQINKKVVGSVELVRQKIKELTIANSDVNITWNEYYNNLKKIDELTKKLALPKVESLSKKMIGAVDVLGLEKIQGKNETPMQWVKDVSAKGIDWDKAAALTEGEQLMADFWDSVSFAGADTLRNGIGQAFEDIFGEANSLLEQFLSNIVSGLASVAAQRVAMGLMDWFSGGLSGNLISLIGKQFGASGSIRSNNSGTQITTIKIGEQTVLKLVNGVLPTAMNNGIRYREIGATA